MYKGQKPIDIFLENSFAVVQIYMQRYQNQIFILFKLCSLQKHYNIAIHISFNTLVKLLKLLR